MSTELITSVIVPIVTAVIGGIGWLVKRYFDKKEEEQKRIFEQRDKDKAEMKNDIKQLRQDVDYVIGAVVGCDHADCPTKKAVADYLKNRNHGTKED